MFPFDDVIMNTIYLEMSDSGSVETKFAEFRHI